MGKALYREYRPKKLSEVIGQSHITDTLTNALKKGAISHAYLFTGPKGVGKTSVARILAHEINNLDYDESKTYLDIIEIDAASNRRIDEIRDLREKVHIAPTSSKYKVYIIDEVHMLTREAFNALLKTLEEPPEHAVFILATTEAHKVPDTIISRTQRYTFKPIGDESAVKHLKTIAIKEKLKISDDALELIAEHGKGSFRDSISMLDQIAGFGHEKISKKEISNLLGFPNDEVLARLLDEIFKPDIQAIFVTVQQLREQGAQPAIIAKSLINLLRTDISENSRTEDLSIKVELMKELLPLTGVNGTYEAIEIAILGIMEIAASVIIEREKIKLPEIKKQLNEANADPEENIKQVITKGEELKSEITKIKTSSEPWENILSSLKMTHNTLYGLLRMAEVAVDDDKVLLTFRFEFHRKKLNDGKNLKALEGQIAEHLGDNFKLEISVQKTGEVKPKVSMNSKNDALTSVSNIFDGAELLES